MSPIQTSSRRGRPSTSYSTPSAPSQACRKTQPHLTHPLTPPSLTLIPTLIHLLTATLTLDPTLTHALTLTLGLALTLNLTLALALTLDLTTRLTLTPTSPSPSPSP